MSPKRNDHLSCLHFLHSYIDFNGLNCSLRSSFSLCCVSTEKWQYCHFMWYTKLYSIHECKIRLQILVFLCNDWYFLSKQISTPFKYPSLGLMVKHRPGYLTPPSVCLKDFSLLEYKKRHDLDKTAVLYGYRSTYDPSWLKLITAICISIINIEQSLPMIV